MFRVMKPGDDGKPRVGVGSCELGVRVGEVDTDSDGNAIANEKGMSVSPRWQDIQLFLIPKRLGNGARGKNSTSCFRRGAGPFERAECGKGLVLVPDSAIHGAVCPVQLGQLAQFLEDLASTRDEWVIDES
jgi:hypothetical protein